MNEEKSQQITLTPIGYVERPEGAEERFSTPEDLRSNPVRIVLESSLSDALLGIESGTDILVLCYFHLSEGYELQIHPRGDPSRPLRGLFATRTQHRPNPISVTSARVLSVQENVLEVIGLDAVNGTPVLDIKIHTSAFDTPYKPEEG